MRRGSLGASARLNADALAQQIVGATVATKQRDFVTRYADRLRLVADEVVAGFFQNMAGVLGQGQLEGQFRGALGAQAQITGVPAWKPLSERYARFKGSDEFWTYTEARNRVIRRTRSARSAIVKGQRRRTTVLRGKPLRKWISERNSLKILGETRVIVDLRSQKVDSLTEVGERRRRLTRSEFEAGYSNRSSAALDRLRSRAADGEAPSNRIERRITVMFELMPKVFALGENYPERTLNKDPSGDQQKTKLIGKATWHRPVMRPLVAYYQQILVRRAWDAALRAQSVSSRDVSTRRTNTNVDRYDPKK